MSLFLSWPLRKLITYLSKYARLTFGDWSVIMKINDIILKLLHGSPFHNPQYNLIDDEILILATMSELIALKWAMYLVYTGILSHL